MSKACKKCGDEKELGLFYNHKNYKDGKSRECIECTKKRGKINYQKNKININKRTTAYNKLHPEITKAAAKRYRNNHPDRVVASIKKYKKNNPEKVKASLKAHHKKNRKKEDAYVKERKANDPLFRLTINMRVMVSQRIRSAGFRKSSKTSKVLGCSFLELRKFIESKWESWMNWTNYGKYNGQSNFGWDIDHIIPLSTAKTEEEIIKLNHYTNLQPLCSYKNRAVKNRKPPGHCTGGFHKHEI